MSFGVIFIVNCVVFYPSLFHFARSDQMIYLNETARIDNLPDLIEYSYSYPRHRTMAKGDNFLFRPILFTFIALEKWFFGFNFFYWQMAGLLLHFIVIWQLLRILWLIRPHILAGLFVLHFSVSNLSQEMVTWHHIHGYLLSLVFMLEAIYHFILSREEGHKSLRRFGIMAAFLTLACFTYEFGLALCAVLIFFVWLDTKTIAGCRIANRKHFSFEPPWLLFAPIALYFLLSFMDYRARIAEIDMVNLAQFDLSFMKIGERILFTLVSASLFGFIPAFIKIIPSDRPFICPVSWQDAVDIYWAHPWACSLNVALIVLIFFVLKEFIVAQFLNARKGEPVRRDEAQDIDSQKILSLGLLGSGIFFSYTVLVSLRLLIHPTAQTYFRFTLYNYYITGLFLTIGLWCFYLRYADRHLWVKRSVRNSIILVFIFLVIINSVKVYGTNIRMKDRHNLLRIYVQTLEAFVKDHKKEADFSFQFVPTNKIQDIDRDIDPAKISKVQDKMIANVLFPQFIKAEDPKYYLLYFDHEGIIPFRSLEDVRRYLRLEKKE